MRWPALAKRRRRILTELLKRMQAHFALLVEEERRQQQQQHAVMRSAWKQEALRAARRQRQREERSQCAGALPRSYRGEARRRRARVRRDKALARCWHAFWRGAARAPVWSWNAAAPPFVPGAAYPQQRTEEEFAWNVHAPIFVPGGSQAVASHAPAIQPGESFGDPVGDFLKEGGMSNNLR